jgi:hypothetical protein
MTAPMHQPEPDCYRWAPGVVFSQSYWAGWDIVRLGNGAVTAEFVRHPYSDDAEDAAKAANVWLAAILAGRRGRA